MKILSYYCRVAIFPIFALLCACGSASGGGEVLYLALGASDATGIGASPITNGYVFRIEAGLNSCGADIALDNLGIPGAKIREIKNIEAPIAQKLNPELITVFAGGNDLTQGTSIEEFEKDFRQTLDGLFSETSAFIVVANLPDLSELPKFQQEPDSDVTTARVNAYNSAIQRVANDFGAPVIDLFSQTISNFLISDDGFHPNDEGHQRIADLFLLILKPRYCK